MAKALALATAGAAASTLIDQKKKMQATSVVRDVRVLQAPSSSSTTTSSMSLVPLPLPLAQVASSLTLPIADSTMGVDTLGVKRKTAPTVIAAWRGSFKLARLAVSSGDALRKAKKALHVVELYITVLCVQSFLEHTDVTLSTPSLKLVLGECLLTLVSRS